MLASKLTPRILVENGKKKGKERLICWCAFYVFERAAFPQQLARSIRRIFYIVHKRTSNTIIIIISNQYISLSSHEFVLL